MTMYNSFKFVHIVFISGEEKLFFSDSIARLHKWFDQGSHLVALGENGDF